MDNIARLLVIMTYLRDPVQGCSWDLEQTFASIAPHTLEEAFEVVDAIERGDFDDLKQELGDLLLQVVYYAQMAQEQNLFDLEQIAKSISDKLVRRHPHVFGDSDFADGKARAAPWEVEKAHERATKRPAAETQSVLDDVALALPALSRAQKLQKRVALVGFDWPNQSGVVAKILEELEELRDMLVTGECKARIEEELGDLLFAVVNLARWQGIDSEGALRAANKKFERRFRAIEAKLAEQKCRPDDCTLQELDALWANIKREERTR
ncbi:MAG TPA: nucleoside triphosphate pyrophosphohydrolase [Gammaproteobacteria bacterium]|nr:nucleoside triphosphate pyrophosphohydrolase [Gammaproteobacteria bacterium]